MPVFTNIKDKKIAIYYQEDEHNQYDEINPTFKPLFNHKIWANYRSTGGNKFYAAKAVGYNEECSFTVNWNEKITGGMKIIYKGKAFNIIRVDDLEGYKKDMKLICESIAFTDADYLQI